MRSESGKELGIPEDYRTGDILHVRIDALETPFGDMQLNMGVRVSMIVQRMEPRRHAKLWSRINRVYLYAKAMQHQDRQHGFRTADDSSGTNGGHTGAFETGDGDPDTGDGSHLECRQPRLFSWRGRSRVLPAHHAVLVPGAHYLEAAALSAAMVPCFERGQAHTVSLTSGADGSQGGCASAIPGEEHSRGHPQCGAGRRGETVAEQRGQYVQPAQCCSGQPSKYWPGQAAPATLPATHAASTRAGQAANFSEPAVIVTCCLPECCV